MIGRARGHDAASRQIRSDETGGNSVPVQRPVRFHARADDPELDGSSMHQPSGSPSKPCHAGVKLTID
jgi:hypothetical protein